MPPALVVLATDADDARLKSALDVGRRVGGVGRVLLFHPAEAESRLTARALGYRLWPQDGETPAARYANAFRQSAELGYEGAVVVRPEAEVSPEQLTEAAAALAEHHGAVIPGEAGEVAVLALQEPAPTLFVGESVPSYDELLTRASQQRIRLVELTSSASSAPSTSN